MQPNLQPADAGIYEGVRRTVTPVVFVVRLLQRVPFFVNPMQRLAIADVTQIYAARVMELAKRVALETG